MRAFSALSFEDGCRPGRVFSTIRPVVVDEIV